MSPKFWTQDAIVTAIQAWAEKHGRQPAAIDWHWAGYGHPSKVTVYERFGSWNAAISAAGFTPQAVGRCGNGRMQQEVLSRLDAPTSIRTLRDDLEVSDIYVRKLVWRLNKLGLVTRVSRGVWVAA